MFVVSSGDTSGPLVASLCRLWGLSGRPDRLGRCGAILGRLGIFLGHLGSFGGLPGPFWQPWRVLESPREAPGPPRQPREAPGQPRKPRGEDACPILRWEGGWVP